MKKRILTVVSITLFAINFCFSSSLAGGIEAPATCVNPWYFTVGGGYAWSTKAGIKVDPRIWDPANEGYNSNLGQSPFITLGFGRRLSEYFLVELSSSYFNDFKYRRLQTSNTTDIVGFTGTSRARYFDITNLNLMLNVIFNSDIFSFCLLNTSIRPFVGGGVGAAWNTIHNFYTVSRIGTSTSIGTRSERYTSLAAQAEAGLSFMFNTMAFDVGYRYYYGGDFRSPSTFFVPTNNPVVLAATPWKGHLSANLLFADMHFSI